MLMMVSPLAEIARGLSVATDLLDGTGVLMHNLCVTFWHYLWILNQHTSGCIARTESTRSHIVYGGNCVQAFLYALKTPGVAWIFS